ncbi:MAG TPA: hypothetical protein VGR37_18970 [Longimicrobiaceae bacterium]|nr:hypothetical protein [Longimicrobiaceae bacterium]
MRLTLLATAFAVLLAGCGDVTEPTARAADAPNRGHINYAEPSVTISGPTAIYTLADAPPSDFTWTATVSGGEAPYTYQWEYSYNQFQWYPFQPTTDSYSTTNSVDFAPEPVTHTFYLRVTVTDKWGHTAGSGTTVRVWAI